MKRLLLLRHAKAEQDPTKADHSRALAPRGRRAAPLVAKAMRKAGFVPDHVLCSAARRTRETWALAAPELKAEPSVEFTEALYLAPWQAIVAVARRTDDPVQALMVVGHNPGLEDCAAALLHRPAGHEERERQAALAEKFPTGALAVIDCAIDLWGDLAPGCGALTAFIKPRDLA